MQNFRPCRIEFRIRGNTKLLPRSDRWVIDRFGYLSDQVTQVNSVVTKCLVTSTWNDTRDRRWFNFKWIRETDASRQRLGNRERVEIRTGNHRIPFTNSNAAFTRDETAREQSNPWISPILDWFRFFTSSWKTRAFLSNLILIILKFNTNKIKINFSLDRNVVSEQ